MLHVNEKIGKLGYLFPDYYQAVSVADFLQSRNDIPIRSKWRFLNPLSYASASLGLKMWEWEMLAYIKFHNVNLGFEEKETYTIQDMTGKFSVYLPISSLRIKLGNCANPNELREGRYFDVSIIYSPKNKWAHLENATQIGPAQADTEKESIDDLINQHS